MMCTQGWQCLLHWMILGTVGYQKASWGSWFRDGCSIVLWIGWCVCIHLSSKTEWDKLQSLSQLSHSFLLMIAHGNGPPPAPSVAHHGTIIGWCMTFGLTHKQSLFYAPTKEPQKYWQSHPIVHPWRQVLLLLLVISSYISQLFVTSRLVVGSIHVPWSQLTHCPTIVAPLSQALLTPSLVASMAPWLP